MAVYTIVPHSDAASFNIEIVGTNGARQTMLGFASEAEAEKWIADDKVRSGDAARPPA